MNSTIFEKKLNDIDFSDIQTLKDYKISESYNLDYKENYPTNQKLAKLMIAFANSSGGFIIIGIKEERHQDHNIGIPKEIVGIEKGDHITKITNIALSHSQPKIFPKIGIIEHSDNSNRVIVIIKINESFEPIMYFSKNDSDTNKWFIRINDKIEPADYSLLKKLFKKENYFKKIKKLEDEIINLQDQMMDDLINWEYEENIGFILFGICVIPFNRNITIIDMKSREFENFLSQLRTYFLNYPADINFHFSDYIRKFIYMDNHYISKFLYNFDGALKEIANIKLYQNGILNGIVINPFMKIVKERASDYIAIKTPYMIYLFIEWLRFIYFLYKEVQFNGRFKLVLRFGSSKDFRLLINDINFPSSSNKIKIERTSFVSYLGDITKVEELTLEVFKEILRYFCNDLRHVDQIFPYFSENYVPEYIKTFYKI